MQEVTPLISVIIPVYKVEKYVERCLRSVSAQTYRNLEIIVVDDGSPDQCGTICDRYTKSDSRVTVYHKKNGGLSEARNYGVGRAHGDLVFFIDSDDYLSADCLEYLYQLMLDNQAEISICAMKRTASDTTEFGKKKELPDSFVVTGIEACIGQVRYQWNIPMGNSWGKLLPISVVIQNPFPVGRLFEDQATTPKYYYGCQRIVIGNRECYGYFSNPNGIMGTVNKSNKRCEDRLWAYKHIAEFYEEHHNTELAKYAWTRLYYYLIIDSIENNGRSDKELVTWFQNAHLPIKKRVSILFYQAAPFLYKKIFTIRKQKQQKITAEKTQ